MKAKRFILMLLVMQLMALNVFADGRGRFGEDHRISWTFTSSTGNLLIEAQSFSPIPLPDFNSERDQPWYEFVFEIKTITLSGPITAVGKNNFSNSFQLETVILSNGHYGNPNITSIGRFAFDGCDNLSNVGTLFDNVTTIEMFAFAGCYALQNVTLPKATTIDDVAFWNCSSLTSITMPLVTQLGSSAFEGCAALTSFTLPTQVTTVSKNLFKGCSRLSNITLHDNITAIGASAFEECAKITAFEIPSAVTVINDATFKGCTGLTSMTFSDKITSIGANAFNGCTGLTEMTVERTTPPTVGSNAFAGVDKSIPLHIPERTLQAYRTADGWKDFTNMQTPPLHYVLNDAEAYTETVNLLCNTLTYNRTFNTANTWQPLFVPFDIEMTAEVLEKCDIAIPYMVATEGAVLPGVTEASGYNVVVVMKLNQGDIAQHGTTYFIRPKTAGDFQIVLNDIVIYNRTSTTTLTCATTSDDYAFVGQYTSGKPSSGTTWYALTNGNFQLGDDSSADLPAQRWYMTKTSKSGVPAYAPARAMRVATWGEEDPTGLGSILTDEMEGNNAIYSISGVRLAQPQKGLNIVNGRKVFIK